MIDAWHNRAAIGAGALSVIASLALGTGQVRAMSHWAVTAEEARLHDVSVGEVPASCGFPGFDSPLFWDGINALWPDCAVAGGTWGHRSVRRDNPVAVVDPGVDTRVHGEKWNVDMCDSPCCCDPDCLDPPISLSLTEGLSITVTREWEWSIGVEVGAGGEAGVPLVAKGFVEASLQSGFGWGGSVSFTDEIACTIHVPACWKAKMRVSVVVRQGALSRMTHDYLYLVTVPPEADCPEAGAEVLYFICPEARRSTLRSDDWSMISEGDARGSDFVRCCD